MTPPTFDPNWRSPEAKARDEWLLSEEGQKCAMGVAQGKHLENRLICAFLAGVEWGKKIVSK